MASGSGGELTEIDWLPRTASAHRTDRRIGCGREQDSGRRRRK